MPARVRVCMHFDGRDAFYQRDSGVRDGTSMWSSRFLCLIAAKL
jgi:hypothetical protein